jgi:hypothetical protein
MRNEKQFSNIILNSAKAIYTCDEMGFIKFYNKAAVKLWGREPVAGKDLWNGAWKTYTKEGTVLPSGKCPMAIGY